MKYVFTKHAEERIKVRKIKKKEVIETIEKNDLKALDDEEENKIVFYKKWKGELTLKVVTVKAEKNIKIITVYPTDSKRLKNVRSLIELK